jgi:stress response protein SCP2
VNTVVAQPMHNETTLAVTPVGAASVMVAAQHFPTEDYDSDKSIYCVIDMDQSTVNKDVAFYACPTSP